MGEKLATRAAYGKELAALAEKYPELVVLDADLASATMTRDFAAAYPERFFDMGIAEADMMGFAAGLAACPGDGTDSAKAHADYICCPAAEGAFADLCEHYLFSAASDAAGACQQAGQKYGRNNHSREKRPGTQSTERRD